MRPLRSVLPLGLLLATTACLEPVELQTERVGVIRVNAFDNGGATVARVEASFIEGAGLTTGIPSTQYCADVSIVTADDLNSFSTLDAGTPLVARLSGNTQEIPRQLTIGRVSYPVPDPNGIPFTPGDTLKVTVPGASNGFPAAEIVVKTAEPFTVGTIAAPVAGQPLELTWGPLATGTVMQASLRYGTEGSAFANRQVFCIFTDDGAGTVPANLVVPYANAAPGTRSVVLTRIRAVPITLAGDVRTVAFSYHASPLPTVGE